MSWLLRPPRNPTPVPCPNPWAPCDCAGLAAYPGGPAGCPDT